MAEFDGLRAQMYEVALKEFPNARNNDIEAMHKHLDPHPNQHILGFGEGNGFFVPTIAKAVGTNGRYVVTDPSSDQLDNLRRNIPCENIELVVCGAEELKYNSEFDSVWSFGCFHHLSNQETAMKNIYTALKPGGKIILCDVWRNSELAEHFDGPVARYCCTGHDVKFLGDTYAKTISRKAGFSDENVNIEELPQKWEFNKKEDIGRFIYNLHAMTHIEGETMNDKYLRVLEGCEQILGVNETSYGYELNWPMKVLTAYK